MAVIRDMMPAFDLFQPASVDDAMEILSRYGDDALPMAGGMDTFEWIKERIRRPRVVVDLGGVEELKGIRSTADGLEIGALTTLTEVVNHADVQQGYDVLAQAAGLVATPQIRNQGTIGGNVSQDTRCHYYRSGWPCYRAGGNICYADTPTSMNREHCVFGASRCVAVNPSDTAPALLALEAEMVVRGRRGERVVAADEFFIGPSIDITRMTIMRSGELLTAIRLPSKWAGARFYFEKVRDRQAWDFPLVNVASAMRLSNGVVDDLTLAVNAVAPYPMRLRAVENGVRGRPLDEETATAAGDMAISGARPLTHNQYKLPLMKRLVTRAIRGTDA